MFTFLSNLFSKRQQGLGSHIYQTLLKFCPKLQQGYRHVYFANNFALKCNKACVCIFVKVCPNVHRLQVCVFIKFCPKMKQGYRLAYLSILHFNATRLPLAYLSNVALKCNKINQIL